MTKQIQSNDVGMFASTDSSHNKQVSGHHEEGLKIEDRGNEFFYHFPKRLEPTTLNSKRLLWILRSRAAIFAIVFGTAIFLICYMVWDLILIFTNVRLWKTDKELQTVNYLYWSFLSAPVYFVVFFPVAFRFWQANSFLDAAKAQKMWLRPFLAFITSITLGWVAIYIILGLIYSQPANDPLAFRIPAAFFIASSLVVAIVWTLTVMNNVQHCDKWSLLSVTPNNQRYRLRSGQRHQNERADCIYISLAMETSIFDSFSHIMLYLTVKYASDNAIHCYVICPCQTHHKIDADSLFTEVDRRIAKSFSVLQFVGKMTNVMWQDFKQDLLTHLNKMLSEIHEYNCRHVALETMAWCRSQETFDPQDHQTYLDAKRQLLVRMRSEKLLTEPTGERSLGKRYLVHPKYTLQLSDSIYQIPGEV